MMAEQLVFVNALMPVVAYLAVIMVHMKDPCSAEQMVEVSAVWKAVTRVATMVAVKAT